jgi:ribosomal protein S18 acetylase RimI-like enzyme
VRGPHRVKNCRTLNGGDRPAAVTQTTSNMTSEIINVLPSDEGTKPLRVQRLTPLDAPAYRAIMLEAYGHHPNAFTSSVAEREGLSLKWWESRLSRGPSAPEVVLGLFKEQCLAGVAGISFDKRDKARHKATLFGMYVLSHFRSSGIGRQLVVSALEHARNRDGIKLVQLTVTDGNRAAQTLYANCGFEQFGLEPFAVAVGDEFVSKSHMWYNLDVLSRRAPAE